MILLEPKLYQTENAIEQLDEHAGDGDQQTPERHDTLGKGFEVYDLVDGRQLLRYTPEDIRKDERTDEPALPLVYFQGINGDAGLGPVMRHMGRDGRQVIAMRYGKKLRGSFKPVAESHPDFHEGSAIPELEVDQADDMIAALQVLGVKKADALATSRGGLRWLVAMKKAPDLFRNAYGEDVAGQDGSGYLKTHEHAVRLIAYDKRRKAAGKLALQSIIDTSEPLMWPTRSVRALRTEQKSAAYADMSALLAEVTAKNPGLTIWLGSDVHDKAFNTPDIQESLERAGALGRVHLIQTDKGGHHIGENGLAIDRALKQMRAMERGEEPDESEGDRIIA